MKYYFVVEREKYTIPIPGVYYSWYDEKNEHNCSRRTNMGLNLYCGVANVTIMNTTLLGSRSCRCFLEEGWYTTYHMWGMMPYHIADHAFLPVLAPTVWCVCVLTMAFLLSSSWFGMAGQFAAQYLVAYIYYPKSRQPHACPVCMAPGMVCALHHGL